MRHRSSFWTYVAVLAPLPACYSSGGAGDDDGTDGPRDEAAEVAPDDARGDDAATDDAAPDTASCSIPQHWVRTTLAIDRLEDASDGAVTVGQTARVLAWVDVGPPGCLEPGRIDVASDPAARIATIVVEGWSNEDAVAGACPPGEPTAMFVALPGLTAGTWMVMDGSAGPAGDPATMTLEILPCDAGCGCLGPAHTIPAGGECTWDCECAPHLQCIGYYTIAGTTARTCRLTCNDDRDCPRREICTSWDDGPSAICEGLGESRCTPTGSCEPGYGCDCGDGEGIPCICAPMMPADGGPCCRDEDCAPGQDCVQPEPEGTAFCAVRCTGDGGCPHGSFCAGSGTPLSGLCLAYE